MLRVFRFFAGETTVTYYRRQRFESFKRAMFARQLSDKSAPRERALQETDQDRESRRPMPTLSQANRPH